jgi:hypothetical protein
VCLQIHIELARVTAVAVAVTNRHNTKEFGEPGNLSQTVGFVTEICLFIFVNKTLPSSSNLFEVAKSIQTVWVQTKHVETVCTLIRCVLYLPNLIIIIIIYLLQLGLHPVAVVLTLHNYNKKTYNINNKKQTSSW